MASKYSKLNLPDLPLDVSPYQEKVNEAKAAIRAAETHTPESLVREYAMARDGVNVQPTIEDIAEATNITDSRSDQEDARRAIIHLFGKDGLQSLLYDAQIHLTAIEQLLDDSRRVDQPGWGTHGAPNNAVRLASGDTLSVRDEPVAKVEDKDACRRWCATPADECFHCGASEHEPTDHQFLPGAGLAEAMQLWPSTLEAITKERLLAGLSEPPGVTAYFRPKIVWTKAKVGE